jgi:hypothetical protein
MTATQPADRLSNEIIKILRQFGLPFEGMIRYADLKRSGIIHDYHHFERLKAIGFPAGRWLSANVKIWTPEEIGTYLLALPVERPVLPEHAKRREKTAAVSKAKTDTVKTKRQRMAR